MKIIISTILFFIPLIIGTAMYGFIPSEYEVFQKYFDEFLITIGLGGTGSFSGFFLFFAPIYFVVVCITIIALLVTVCLPPILNYLCLRWLLDKYYIVKNQIFYYVILWVGSAFLAAFICQNYEQYFNFGYEIDYSFTLPVAMLASISYVFVWLGYEKMRQQNL